MANAAAIISSVKENIGVIGAGAAGLALGSGVGIATGIAISKKKKSKRKSSYKRIRKRNRLYKRRKYKYARTAGKRKDRSHRRIRMTKTGQPYIILASGKARFISKRSAHLSRKRRRGRY